jgi:predicted transposase/invertase (TIGR01784 family)
MKEVNLVKNSTLLNEKIFRHIFGRNESAPILVPFLNALVRYEGDRKMKKCEVVTHHDTGMRGEKAIEFHYVHAKDEQMRHYSIDLQIREEPYTSERALCNLMHLCANRVKKDVALHKRFRGIGISILNFTAFPGNEYHNVFMLLEKETGELLTDAREIIIFELPKFAGESVESLSTPMEKWLHLLKYSEKYAVPGEELPTQLRDEEGIQEAVNIFRAAI